MIKMRQLLFLPSSVFLSNSDKYYSKKLQTSKNFLRNITRKYGLMAAEAVAFRLFAVTCVRTGDSDVSRITDAILVVNAVGCLALYINGLGRMFGSA